MTSRIPHQPGLTRRSLLRTTGALGTAAAASSLLPGWRAALAAEDAFDLFRVALWAGMPNLDPDQNNLRTCLVAQNWLFDPLLVRNAETNDLEPYLAQEYSFQGNNTWRFKLREGAKFHNGKPVDANAVKYTIERRQSEEIGSPHSGTWSDIEEVKVVDQYTADFLCRTPFPTLPAYLIQLSILEPGHYAEHSMDHLALNPLGSGPFRMDEFRPDDILRATRNDDYWGELPPIRRLEAPVVQENSTRVSALLAGDLNIAPRPPVEDFDRIESSDVARLTADIGNRIVLAGLNYDMEPMKDKRVRQALNHAVNQQEINEVYLRGMGEIMAGPLPSTVLGHHPGLEPYPYDPELARSLLKEAGYPDGFTVQIETVPQWMIAGAEITQAIASYLRQVGIKAELRVNDAGTQAARITTRKAGPMYMLSWGGNSTFDGDSYIGILFDEGAWSTNYMPEVGKLVKAARGTADQQERREIYRKAGEIIHEEAPWIFLHLQPNPYGATLDHDWQSRPDEMIPLTYVNKTA